MATYSYGGVASVLSWLLLRRRVAESSEQGDDTALVCSPPLRICVFGSSSSATPELYLAESRELGRLCATAGHVCVTGAGKTGCMGALNVGCLGGGGRVEGVIHAMWMPGSGKDELQHGLSSLVVADGPTLAQRKDLLCRPSDAFIVLPGGAGTLDEAFEMVSEQQLGLPKGAVARPVCFLNIDGYYDGTVAQLQRARDDGILYVAPDDVAHMESSARGALAWVVAAALAARAEHGARGVATDEHRAS